MATKTADRSTTTTEPGAAGAAAAAPPVESVPKGWTEVASDRLMYKPEMCQGRAVQGILLTRLELPDGPQGGPWYAYVIRLTAPTLGVDRDDAITEVPAGQELLLPENYRLADLKRAAENLDSAFEVWIKPKKLISLGGGKNMWTFTVAVNPKAMKRTEDMKFFLGNNTTGAPQLAAGRGANGGAIGADAIDVPFG